jgi:hypothetical protein
MAVSKESIKKAGLELSNAEAALRNANDAFKPSNSKPKGLKMGDPGYAEARRAQQEAQERVATAKKRLDSLKRSEKQLTASQRAKEQASQVPTVRPVEKVEVTPEVEVKPVSTGGKVDTKPDSSADANKDKGEKTKSKEELYADAIALASKQYNMPDILFKNVDSLKTLLQRYVDGKLTDNQLKREIELDPWYRQNSAEIKARYVQLFNYEDLVKTGRAQGTTDYEQQLDGIVRKLQARARELNGVEIPDDQAKLIAKDLYIYNLDNDPAILTERLVRFIRPTAGMIGGIPTTGYAGQALQNYQGLQAIAKANGLRIEDLLPRDATGMQQTAEGILEQLALGKVDINRVAQDARKLAALGQPDYVKDLLGQGYDLDSIYSPYRTAMANTLELDPNTISLSDPALRMGIGKEGDMNLYDFERSLRKDNRWQYTQQARGEVSDVALRVLRDFGFTG